MRHPSQILVSRQSTGDLDAVAGVDETTRFFYKRPHWKRAHARDVLPPHQLHGDDDRTCDWGKTSSKRRTKPPNAGIIRDCAVVGPGSDTTWKFDTYETENPQGNWDRKARQISEIA